MPAPRVLVADDNPLSLHFLTDAVESAGCLAAAATDGAEAVAVAQASPCDLMLLDLRMPKLDGAEALARIRAEGASRHAAALATTALERSSPDAARLGAGFAEVLHKPLTIADLHAALARHLPRPAAVREVFDDAQALSAAGGNADIVAALRGLLAAELDALPAEAAAHAAASDANGLRERLHRLDASAGFCGVPALTAAGRQLRAALDADAWRSTAIEEFLRACAAVRERLP